MSLLKERFRNLKKRYKQLCFRKFNDLIVCLINKLNEKDLNGECLLKARNINGKFIEYVDIQ